MKKTISLALSALLVSVGAASAQILVNEDFESYGDTTGMQANWGNSGLGSLVSTNGNPGNSAFHPGGTVNSWIGSAISVTPSPTEFIRLTADIYDDGTSANKRMTVGFRGGPFPLFEMGMYNSPAHYALRIVSFSGSESWVTFPDGGGFTNAPVAGWHRFSAEIYDDQTIVTLDLFADGNVDSSYTSVGAASVDPFTDLRFGGPSNLSSAGGGAWFDNILLEKVIIPEPTTFALGGLALLTLATRRRWTRR
jgi:hypothetical protein